MPIIVIVGPTGVGKTKLSIELAKKFNGEVINADSTQIYKKLDIATAKVTKKEMNGIKHHLLSIKEIDEDYTVFDYQTDARNTIDILLKNKKTPILVGGTGLYIKAALYNYKFLKEDKRNDYSFLSNDELYNKVIKLDSNNHIHKNNRKRLERALDYMERYNQTYSSKEKTDKLLYDVIFISLMPSHCPSPLRLSFILSRGHSSTQTSLRLICEQLLYVSSMHLYGRCAPVKGV